MLVLPTAPRILIVLFSMFIVAKIMREFKNIGETKVCVIRGLDNGPCPICEGRLYHYDSRLRSVRVDEEKHYHFLLRRMRCSQCRKIHLELPDFLLPRGRCFKAVIERALKNKPVAVVKDPRTPMRWRKWWRRFGAYLRAAVQALIHRQLLDEQMLEHPLPELAKDLVNHQLWPFHLLWDWSPPMSPLHSP